MVTQGNDRPSDPMVLPIPMRRSAAAAALGAVTRDIAEAMVTDSFAGASGCMEVAAARLIDSDGAFTNANWFVSEGSLGRALQMMLELSRHHWLHIHVGHSREWGFSWYHKETDRSGLISESGKFDKPKVKHQGAGNDDFAPTAAKAWRAACESWLSTRASLAV